MYYIHIWIPSLRQGVPGWDSPQYVCDIFMERINCKLPTRNGDMLWHCLSKRFDFFQVDYKKKLNPNQVEGFLKHFLLLQNWAVSPTFNSSFVFIKIKQVSLCVIILPYTSLKLTFVDNDGITSVIRAKQELYRRLDEALRTLSTLWSHVTLCRHAMLTKCRGVVTFRDVTLRPYTTLTRRQGVVTL